jgi:hypothetical protein
MSVGESALEREVSVIRSPRRAPSERTPLAAKSDASSSLFSSSSVVLQDVMGTSFVGLSALLFGGTVACARYVDLNALFFMAGRAPVDWLLALFAVFCVRCYWRPDSSLWELLFFTESGRNTQLLALGRAVCWWAFSTLWIAALTLMPSGDATALIFTLGPFLTGVFAYLILGEPMKPLVLGVFAVNVVGAAMVLQPPFLFGGPQRGATYWRTYLPVPAPSRARLVRSSYFVQLPHAHASSARTPLVVLCSWRLALRRDSVPRARRRRRARLLFDALLWCVAHTHAQARALPLGVLAPFGRRRLALCAHATLARHLMRLQPTRLRALLGGVLLRAGW